MKRWTAIWPQHEKRLEQALIENFEQAADGSDGPSVPASRRASVALARQKTSAPKFSNESLKGYFRICRSLHKFLQTKATYLLR